MFVISGVYLSIMDLFILLQGTDLSYNAIYIGSSPDSTHMLLIYLLEKALLGFVIFH